jgi:hypothetical protein
LAKSGFCKKRILQNTDFAQSEPWAKVGLGFGILFIFIFFRLVQVRLQTHEGGTRKPTPSGHLFLAVASCSRW